MILLLVVCSCFIAVAVPYLVNRQAQSTPTGKLTESSRFGFGLRLPSDYSNSGTCRINAGFKVDCLPDLPQSYVVSQAAQTDCRVRGCCYDNTTGEEGGLRSGENEILILQTRRVTTSFPPISTPPRLSNSPRTSCPGPCSVPVCLIPRRSLG